MNFNPADKVEGGGRATAGRYRFKVDDAEEKVFRSGNEGLALTLLVGAFKDRDVKVFDRHVFLPQSLWTLEAFLAAVGLPFDPSIDARDLLGLTGEANFVVGDNGYLEVESYVPVKAGNAAAGKKANGKAPTKQVEATDDVPF